MIQIKLTQQEREALKSAKINYKHNLKVKPKQLVKSQEQLAQAILKSRTPRWGNIKVSVMHIPV